MGTPHVHCMSKLPTAHEPVDHVSSRLGDGQRPGGRADVARQAGGAQLNGVGAPAGQSSYLPDLGVTTRGASGPCQ
jgi:hypothetical protein